MTPSALASSDDDFANRRAHARVSVALPAFLIIGGRRYSVQILDLSAGGARIDCAAALVAASATVTLDWGGAKSVATVRWREGRLAGLAFTGPLDERDVAALAVRSAALAARMGG